MENAYDQLLDNVANTIVENNLEDVCLDDVDIVPCNASVLILPYEKNPYREVTTTESWIIVGIESSKTYKSNETGEIEQNNDVIRVGKVIAHGPACQNVEDGDDVFFTTYSMTPVPFRKKGYVMVGENLLICRIVKK